MEANGKVFKYGDNIDTDVIIPARYLNVSDAHELAKYCMIDIDKNFANNVKKGDVIVAGKNFGCGSSREHAPLSIKTLGVSCVIAKTFARIFYRNAINIGMPILECEEASRDIEDGNEISINFDTGIITNITKNCSYKAQPFPNFIKEIMKSDGLVKQVQGSINKNKCYDIAVIEGDGIGPEVTGIAVNVLKKIAEKYEHSFIFTNVYAGGAAIDIVGECLPEETLLTCKRSDAILFGAVGGPKWDNIDGDKRPERALLRLRSELGLYANLRPAIMHKALKNACPLKDEIVEGGIDIMVVRELAGGIYFGDKGYKDGKAYDCESYSKEEIRRIGKTAFELAMKRNKKLVSVDKANVLESSRLWREVITEMSTSYPEIELTHMYVDNAAMQLVKNPRQFDVIVTSNMFGDILSDEASMITGSIGLLASASLGETGVGMYEPIHGSAPDIAFKDIANPIAAILSTAMMLRYSFNMIDEANDVEMAVSSVLNEGYRTEDIMTTGMKAVGTLEMGRLILKSLEK